MFKIVIVDDEVHIRSLIEQTLEDIEDEFAVEVATAVNGAEGLALIRDSRPQLVFLDVMMPVMNGYDVCGAVKADPGLQGVTVVILTAKGQETDRARGHEVGADHFLTKPFDPDELVALARAVLGRCGEAVS